MNNFSKSKQAFFLFFLVLKLHLIMSVSAFATSLSANFNQLEHTVVFASDNIQLKPSGGSLYFSTDISNHWTISFDYQHWQDNKNYQSLAEVDLKLSTWGGGISYYQDNWYFSTSISSSEDDLSITNIRRNNNYRNEVSQTTSLTINSGYNWSIDNWLFDISFGAQFSDWDITTKQQRQKLDKPDLFQSENTQDNSTSLNTGLSASYFWPLSNNTGVLVGTILSWHYMVTDDEILTSEQSTAEIGELPSRTGNRLSRQTLRPTTSINGSNTTSRPTSGDDNYGQLTLYFSYDINQSLSIDFDTGFELASDDNNQNSSIGISYSF